MPTLIESITHPSGTPMTSNVPVATVTLDIELLEAIAKSLNISKAVSLKKGNVTTGHVQNEARRDYRLLSDACVEIEDAIDQLLND